MTIRRALAACTLAFCASLAPAFALAQAGAPEAGNGGSANTAEVLRAFDRPADDKVNAATDRTRRWVMFAMGAPLLLLLVITASLGIAMGVYGKQVYLPHMVFAGLSLTLAIAHAVVGLVWFRPF
jgi:hypothetical protein